MPRKKSWCNTAAQTRRRSPAWWLCCKGWLQCAPHEHDKRSRCLHLSPQGKALFQAVHDARAKLAAELLQPVPEALQAQLLEMLEKLRGQLRA